MKEKIQIRKRTEYCVRCTCELTHQDAYECLACSVAVKESLLGSEIWRELAVKRPGDRLDESLLDTMAREHRQQLNELDRRLGRMGNV